MVSQEFEPLITAGPALPFQRRNMRQGAFEQNLVAEPIADGRLERRGALDLALLRDRLSIGVAGDLFGLGLGLGLALSLEFGVVGTRWG